MLVLSVLLLAVAASPAPRPTATNPFTLAPIPAAGAPLPVIGTTRSRPLCSAIRQAVAPAVRAAMRNDQVYHAVRSSIFDYVVKDSDEARDLHLMQMDRQVDDMVKQVDALKAAVESPSLDVPHNANPEDGKSLRDLRATLKSVLSAQQVQLDAMSGFVETERMRRFGKFNETETNMNRATQPNTVSGMQADPDSAMNGFLKDSKQFVLPQHQTVQTLGDAHRLDRDFGDIAAVTAAREEKFTQVVVPAAKRCQ